MSVGLLRELPPTETYRSSPIGSARAKGAIARWGLLGSIGTDLSFVFLAGLMAGKLPLLNPAGKRLIWAARFQPTTAYVGFLVIYAAVLVLVALSQNLYNPATSDSHTVEAFLVFRCVLFTTLLLTAFFYLSGNREIPRIAFAGTAMLSAMALAGWRAVGRRRRAKQLARGIGLHHALIIGAGKVGQLFATYLEQNPQWGYSVRGFLDSNDTDDPRVLGDLADLGRVVREEFIDEVFITIPSEREIVKQVVLEAYQLGICAKVMPDLYDGLAWQKPVEFLGEFALRVMHREPIPEPELLLKRIFDIAGSALGLIVLAPVFAVIAAATKLDSPGPVLYSADRVGRRGRKFACHKFRSMVQNADEAKTNLRLRNERQGPFFKMAGDPRITRVGKFLRRYSLDELPQLWNVLAGEMSLVGPRPHPVDDYQHYTTQHLRRLDVTPGITCLWQITARDDPSFERALALDNQYIENWSFLLDLRILLNTIPSLLKGSGI